jgi:hypothetical protein
MTATDTAPDLIPLREETEQARARSDAFLERVERERLHRARLCRYERSLGIVRNLPTWDI